MEQAEKLVDRVCIIARGQKLLEGSLQEIKQRAAADGLISLGFADAAARAAAEPVLADRTLVTEQRAPRAAELADCEVVLAAGATSSQLLAALLAAAATLRRFELVVPTLHQIFVDRVGESAAVAERRPEA